MTWTIGNFLITISFQLIDENLEEDILCDENGDWKLSNTGDWLIADGKKAVEQDLRESFHLKPFEDFLDIQEGSRIHDFKNVSFGDNTVIELKQAVREWLSKDDRIDTSSLEVQIERRA